MRTCRSFTLASPQSSTAATPAVAQPYAFFIHRHLRAGYGESYAVAECDLASGAVAKRFDVPRGATLGTGTPVSDGSNYLLPTSAGIARIRAATREFEGLFGPPIAGTLVEGPSGLLLLVVYLP